MKTWRDWRPRSPNRLTRLIRLVLMQGWRTIRLETVAARNTYVCFATFHCGALLLPLTHPLCPRVSRAPNQRCLDQEQRKGTPSSADVLHRLHFLCPSELQKWLRIFFLFLFLPRKQYSFVPCKEAGVSERWYTPGTSIFFQSTVAIIL